MNFSASSPIFHVFCYFKPGSDTCSTQAPVRLVLQHTGTCPSGPPAHRHLSVWSSSTRTPVRLLQHTDTCPSDPISRFLSCVCFLRHLLVWAWGLSHTSEHFRGFVSISVSPDVSLHPLESGSLLSGWDRVRGWGLTVYGQATSAGSPLLGDSFHVCSPGVTQVLLLDP